MTSDNRTDILITKFFSGEALPEEAIELEDWINISAENKSYFDNYLKIFALNVDIISNDKTRAWKNINDTILKGEKNSKSKVINWRLAGIAASIALIFGIGLFINNQTKKEKGIIVYKAETASRKILLKDNSEIIVMPNSSIAINKEYAASNRKIALNGSATFSIIHNPSQVLIIDVNSLHIKDIGTKFSVLASPMIDTIFIIVADGEISVYDDFGSSENAGAGENVLYIKSKKKLQVFHIKHDAAITTSKPDEKNVVTKKTDSLKKIHSIASPDWKCRLS